MEALIAYSEENVGNLFQRKCENHVINAEKATDKALYKRPVAPKRLLRLHQETTVVDMQRKNYRRARA